VLAEDVVFGTLRSRRCLDGIVGRDDLPFEHRNNLQVEEAATLARAAGLRETARFTAAQTDSTLWILVLSKGRDGDRE
jgi:hypothetical protein